MFKEQVTTDIYVGNIIYALGIVCVLLACAGVFILDLGLVRRKNAIDTLVQKLVAGCCGAIAFAPIGYSLWVWQIYDAIGVPSPLKQAITDYWIGGVGVNTYAQNLDPKVYPGADQFQVFMVLFVIFAFFLGVVIQSVGMERMRPGALYLLSAAGGGIVMPVLYYLVWGGSSPLTNSGVHDFVGSMAVYMGMGGMGLAIAWRLKPRLGRFTGGDAGDIPGPTSIPLVAIGVALVLPALTFFPLVAGYVIPGAGFTGISMTTTSFGIVLENLWAAILGGGAMGAILSYRTRNAYWAIAGPFVGYVCGTTLFDVARPWYMFLIGCGAPVVTMYTIHALERLRIDEDKLVPLILGPAVYGALVGGFTEWGTKTGGYFGITSGPNTFQGAEITPWTQLLGVVVSVGIGFAVALVGCLVLEAGKRLRVTPEQERAGMDATYWQAVDPLADTELDELLRTHQAAEGRV
jgi:ammonium transporter, Amt family